MFSLWVITLIKMQNNEASKTLTTGGYAIRICLLLCMIGIYVFLFVFLQKRCKKGSVRKSTTVILSCILIAEVIVLLPFLQGEKAVPLEYVGCVETIGNRWEMKEPVWYTNCSIYGESAEKATLEREFNCDLTGLALNTDQYTYLFSLSYQEVLLTYSNWSVATDQLIPPQAIYWYGNLEVYGEPVENTIYIFRFPKKTIVPYELQWL